MAQNKTHKSKYRSVTRWLVSVFILAFLIWLLYIYTGKALCHIALGQIAQLTNTKIRIGSVDFHADGSVFIEDLIVGPRRSKYENAAIINARKVYAHFSPTSLLLFHPRLNVIDVNDFVFNAQYDLDTGWSNLSSLKIKPPEDSFSKMPRIILDAGTLQYSKISNGQEEIAISIPINATFRSDEETKQGYIFEIRTATMSSGFGTSRLTGSWKPGLVTIAGGISSLDVPELEMAWLIDVLAAELKYDQNKDFSLKLRVRDLQSKSSESLDKLAKVGPPFLEKSNLFTALQRFFGRFQPRGRVDVELDVTGNFDRLNQSTLTGQVDCKDVAFFYSGFKYEVENLVGRLDFTKSSLKLNDLIAKHNDVELRFNGWSRGFGQDRQYQIRITSDEMPLDNDLYNALSAEQKEFWDYFSPVGQSAVDLLLSRRSSTERQMKLSLGLRDVDAVYCELPYPLKNMTGKISFERGNIIFSDVVSLENDLRITLNGQIKNVGSAYDILVDVNNIPLDSRLEEILPERQRNIYQRLCPSGFASGRIMVSAQDNASVNYRADLSFRDVSLHPEELPLPIHNISARAVFAPDLIDVNDFLGRYGESPIRLSGDLKPAQEQQRALYDISLSLEDMQLDDDFFNLLPESLKDRVVRLKPDGKINLGIDLNKKNLSDSPEYRITMTCLGNNIKLPNYPNPLKDIKGDLTIDTNSIELEDVSVTIGDCNWPEAYIAAIKVNGELALDNDKISSASLQLSAKDIELDERLEQFLPQQTRSFYNKILPSGSFDLDFNDIRIDIVDEGQKSIEFNGAVALHECGLNISGIGTQLDMVLKAEGLYQTEEGLCRCKAEIDKGRVRIQGKSLTNLKADIFYDPNQQNWFTEDFVSNCYGGKTIGKLELMESFNGPLEHVLQIAFDNVDLNQYLSDKQQEQSHDHTYTSGKMSGSLSVNTHVAGGTSRIGSLRLIIVDMQVGKLSPLGKLLQVLNLTEPKDYAFDRMFVDSYIKGDNLFIETLDLSGQGIAFHGSGWLDLVTRNIDMKLTARGKRLATDDPSILQSLTEGLGQAVVRMEVTGNFNDPVIVTKALPVIEETLQILGTKPKTSD
jgi:hypothetical protein